MTGTNVMTRHSRGTVQFSLADRYHFTVTHCTSCRQRQGTLLHNVGTYLPSSQKTVAVMKSHSYTKCNVRRALIWNLKFPQN